MLKLYSTSLPLKSITKKYELKLKKAHKILNASKAKAFLNLPKQDAKEITKQTTLLLKKFEDIVIVGMGGSILGSQMLFKTLKPRFYNFLNDTIKKKSTRIHFIDTLDPHLLLSYGDILNKKHTLFIFVSKSGDTLETSSLFELINKGATEWFGKNFREHLLIMTENKEGHLYKEAIKNRLNIIPLPKNIGGRYSVLTEAGLIPATFMNIDIKNLLKGAQNMINKAKGIEMEISLIPLYENQNWLLPQVLEYMEQNGFQLNSIVPAFTDNNTGVVLQCNGIFFRKK